MSWCAFSKKKRKKNGCRDGDVYYGLKTNRCWT